MKQDSSKTLAIFNAFTDMLINMGALYLAMLILGYEKDTYSKTTMAIATVCAVSAVIVYFACDMYSSTVLDKLHKVIIKLAGAEIFILSVLVVVITVVTSIGETYYKLLLLTVALSFATLSLKNTVIIKVSHSVRRGNKHKTKVLIVGNGNSARAYKKQIDDNPHYGYEIVGCVSEKKIAGLTWYGGYQKLGEVLEELNPDEVVIGVATDEEPLIEGFIDVCEKSGIRVTIIPSMYRYFKSKCQVDMVGTLPVINTRNIPLDNPANAAAKRILDIVLSLIAIIITSPIMIIAAIGVRLSSKGPVIFKQQRVGKNNKIFTMYKFRSMRVNNQETTGWTTPTDSRKTKFGTFMRKTGIDELPQFFNVLFGSMSIVGPRPELPAFVEKYSKTVPLYKVKHQVQPGITGLAQIYGFRGDTSIEGRIEMDIKYIEGWTPFSDIKIIMSTPFKMFNRNEKYVK